RPHHPAHQRDAHHREDTMTTSGVEMQINGEEASPGHQLSEEEVLKMQQAFAEQQAREQDAMNKAQCLEVLRGLTELCEQDRLKWIFVMGQGLVQDPGMQAIRRYIGTFDNAFESWATLLAMLTRMQQ